MNANPGRLPAILAILVLMLALALGAFALKRGGDVLMIGLGLLLAATSMELFRRAYPPSP